MNLFIAVILDGYYLTIEEEKDMLNSKELEKFQISWSKFDPEACGFIDVSCIEDLLRDLGGPLGWDDSYENNSVKRKVFLDTLMDSLETFEDG